ncbi:MAG: GHKL domain-containing protein [Ruminococcus flavefaciens]|nr:GHKL domain-containing protein [Ruminococcus flavefaciens]
MKCFGFMMELVMSGWIILTNCLLEIGSLMKVVEALTGKKGSRKNILQYIIIVMMLAVGIYTSLYDGSRVLQLVHHIGLFLIFKIRYRMDFVDTVTYTILSFLVVGILELVAYIPYNLLYYFFRGEGDCSVLLVFIVFLLCCLLEKKKIIAVDGKWINFYKEKVNVQFLFILFALLLAFVVNRIQFDKGMSWGEGIYLLTALFIFLVFTYKIGTYQMELDYHKHYAHKYGEVVTELRERQHKFMNQLDSIYAMCKIYDNYDELVQHQSVELEHLRKYLMPGKLLVLERPLVVAHIYTKLCEAEEKKISVNTEFSCSLECIKVPDIFLIEILGNLLDNAMDEVSARGKGEKIRLSIKEDGDEICLSVGNAHEKIPYKEYSHFFQEEYSLKGSRRGVGLPYVKKIADKFHGRIEVGNVMYGTDNYFVISAYFLK